MPRIPAQPFNLLLNADDKRLLDELADVKQQSRGQVLREALRLSHRMTVAGVALCANGQPCFVPQMHQMRPPAPGGQGNVPTNTR